MLREWFQYFTTPALPIAKKMGFLDEAIAMSARHRRCKIQWGQHFEKCRNAILEAVEQDEVKQTILILGAGSLDDIPLEELSHLYQDVVLVDLVFLNPARQRVSEFNNVRLVEADVSNSLESAYSGSLQQKIYPSPVDETTVSCVVSLNLVTQMPLIPVRWLIQKYHVDELQADAYAKKMTQAHLGFMCQFVGIKCLIADRAIKEFNQDNQCIDEFDPAWEVVLPAPSIEWDWEVIPFGEVSRSLRQVNRVGVSIW